MIRATNITKRFGDTTVLDNVSFEVEDARSCVITGPSGSGKTTLLRLIAGLELPDVGELSLGGELVSTPGWGLAPHRRHIGFVFQSPALWPHLTVRGNVLFGLGRLTARERESRVTEAIEQTGLEGLENRYPGQLSGGEKRRVAIARALAPKPRYLLMDEPLTNLDPQLKERLLSFILKTQKETGACLVYVTHDETEGRTVATSERHLVLQAGRITRVGSPVD